MPSGKSAARESLPGVLGANGTIDLSGQGSKPPSRPASGRPSGDAWIVDRARRSLMPAPITEENSPGDGDEDGRLDVLA
mgnify:CR=1 FL=1